PSRSKRINCGAYFINSSSGNQRHRTHYRLDFSNKYSSRGSGDLAGRNPCAQGVYCPSFFLVIFYVIRKGAIMSKFWSPVVRELEPYVPGEQPQIDGLIKLNTNESPYPPSPKVIDLITHDAIERLRLYPDPNSKKLKETIAAYYQVKTDQIFVGNGSDEVLALLFMAFFQQGKPLLFPDISYSFYPVY